MHAAKHKPTKHHISHSNHLLHHSLHQTSQLHMLHAALNKPRQEQSIYFTMLWWQTQASVAAAYRPNMPWQACVRHACKQSSSKLRIRPDTQSNKDNLMDYTTKLQNLYKHQSWLKLHSALSGRYPEKADMNPESNQRISNSLCNSWPSGKNTKLYGTS